MFVFIFSTKYNLIYFVGIVEIKSIVEVKSYVVIGSSVYNKLAFVEF